MKNNFQVYKIICKPAGVIARYYSFSPSDAIAEFLYDNPDFYNPERLKARLDKVLNEKKRTA